jgi:TPP-dependent pyruvate/acetoin dehydrogenase alpha subunit
MHLIDASHGVMGASAVVGTTIAHAVGYAYAMRYLKKNSVVVSFFGDGATDEGVYYECLNFAALKRLPLIFICENNSYAIHTHQLRRQPESNAYLRAQAFNIRAERIEDDVLRVYEKVSAAVRALRAGDPGPFYFECMTYRWREHVGPNEDFHLGYRNKEEAEPWIANDQVKKIAEILPAETRKRIEQEIEEEIAEAFAYAEASPFPAQDELFTDVFKR